MELDTLVVAYDSERFVEAALRSLAPLPGLRSVRLVDHATRPTSATVACAAAGDLGLDVVAVHDPANPGFAAGVNRLAATSDAPWLLLLNPDATVQSWPWGRHDDPPEDVVGAAQYDHGSALEPWGRDYRVRDEIARSWFRRRPRPRQGFGFVGGGAMLIRRSAFEALGGLDERYFLFYEDIDFCLRAAAQGFRVDVHPQWVVEHSLGHSIRRNWDQALRWSYESGRQFHRQHGHSVVAYQLFTVADNVMRVPIDLIRGQPRRARARARLAIGVAKGSFE